MAVDPKTYDEGLRDGKIAALERLSMHHTNRLDAQAERIHRLEKIAWAMLGIIALMQFAPGVKAMFIGASVVGLK